MKRGAPLSRRTPLRAGGGQLARGARLERVTRVNARRDRPRRSERERDPDHLAAVHALPCYAAGTVPGHVCEGRIEADHQGARPLGRKADDATAVPLCSLAHRQRTDWSGPFRSWDKATMRLSAGIAWARAHIVLDDDRGAV